MDPAVHDRDAILRHARVLEPQREVARAQAGDRGVLDARREGLEVRVPDPGHVARVGIPIVERAEDAWPAVRLEERADRGVEARGVLDQEQPQPAPLRFHDLEPAERGLEPLERADRGRERDVERTRRRERRERVVRVVQTGERDDDVIDRARDRARQVYLARVRAQAHDRGGEIAARPLEPAVVAAPVTDVREDHSRVAER